MLRPTLVLDQGVSDSRSSAELTIAGLAGLAEEAMVAKLEGMTAEEASRLLQEL